MSGKKTPRAAGRGSSGISGICRHAPAQADVSGRSPFWPDQRRASLLGQKAAQTLGSRHGDAAIHLCLWGAVSPVDGRFDSLILPQVNSTCMQVFLDEIAARYPNENVVIVLDGVGWSLESSPQRMRSIAGWDWIINSVSN